MLQLTKSFFENRGKLLQGSDISKKNQQTAGKKPPAVLYFKGSIMEKAEPCPGSETTLI